MVYMVHGKAHPKTNPSEFEIVDLFENICFVVVDLIKALDT
jgi:hypothetical protein